MAAMPKTTSGRSGKSKASRRSGRCLPGPDPSSSSPSLPHDIADSEALSAFLAHTLREANRPLDMDAILRITKLPRRAKKKVEAALFGLQEQGHVLRGSTGWSLPARLRHIEGVLSVQRAGMGFVTPSGGKPGPDVYIHPAAMNGAWHGDSVEVLVLPGKRGPRPEGRITKVLRRAHKELPVYALNRQKHGVWACSPVNTRIPALFLVDVSSLGQEVRANDLLLVTPGEQAGPNLWEGTATLNLEQEETPLAQERLVKSKFDIPHGFSQAVLELAESYPQDPSEEDFEGRRDLRDCPFVTIDGREARDFDDAVHVEEDAAGYRLRVAIADVSHYVRPDSPLDAEARLRGNSYYFPLSVEPMLPEALSNGLCSLNPGVVRLAMVAEIRFSNQGHRQSAELYPAVISSRARLTYGQIERGLLLQEKEEEKKLGDSLPMLRRAEALARRMTALRSERGSLDFDIPEAEVCFNDQREIIALVPRKRHFGHRLIEEFMIAANEAVAEFLEQHGQGTLFRVHPPPDPDKLKALMDFLSSSGLGEPRLKAASGRRGVRKLPSSRDVARLLAEVKGSSQEYTVNRLLLRSMMQARYAPDNEGHFGLASACYCHFTSPIRRYADLVVHRALKLSLSLQETASGSLSPSNGALTRTRLTAIADRINETERIAAEAEREINKRLAILFLRGREGELFQGMVSGLMEFGIFVELPSVMAEGMIRLADLTDDYYQYFPEKQEIRGTGSRRIFRLGQAVEVVLADVSIGRLEITLALAQHRETQENLPSSGLRKAGRASAKASGRRHKSALSRKRRR